MYNLLNGIQLFPFDLRDEGVDTVLHNISARLGANVIFPAVNYIEQRQPYPKGVLPHNDIHDVYHTDGGAYFLPDFENYPPGLSPVPTTEENILDWSWYDALSKKAQENGLETLPWVCALHGAHGNDPEVCVRDLSGRPIRGWLCPNNPDTRPFLMSLVSEVVEKHPCDGIFLDRIRFPEWGGKGSGFPGMLSCFCEKCVAAAKQQNIDLERVKAILPHAFRSLYQMVSEHNASQVPVSSIDFAKFMHEYPEVLEFITFRQRSIARLVETISQQLRNHNKQLWLDLWPPSYGWLLGQNFSMLKKYADIVRIFTYHKLGGGIDVYSVLSDAQSSNSSLLPTDLWETFRVLFGFKGASTLEEFRVSGLSPDFVHDETTRAKAEVSQERSVLAGVQLWDIHPEDIRQAVRAAFRAQPGGIVFYNYGRAELEHMDIARQTIESEYGTIPL